MGTSPGTPPTHRAAPGSDASHLDVLITSTPAATGARATSRRATERPTKLASFPRGDSRLTPPAQRQVRHELQNWFSAAERDGHAT